MSALLEHRHPGPPSARLNPDPTSAVPRAFPGESAVANETSPAGPFAIWLNLWRNLLQPPWSFQSGWPWLTPLLALSVMTAVFRFTNLDLTISSWFYNAETREWTWFFSSPCTLFYRMGIYPPFVLMSCGVILVLFGRMLDSTWSLTRAGLFLVLLMLVAPGGIVNVGFKGHWGRARPHQVEPFGGRYAYSPIGSPGPLLHGNSSFPSGHAAIAFYMMAPGFLVSRNRPRLMQTLFLLGIAYGLGMSVTRVIQGGHFTSDVLWAGGIVYLTGVVLSRLVLPAHLNAAADVLPGRHQSISDREAGG